MIETLSKLEMGKNFLNWINNIYIKPTVNIKLNGEKLEAFPVRSETKQAKAPQLFNIVLEVLANAMKQEKEIKGTLVEKKEIKLSLLPDDMTGYVENLKESTKNSWN